MAYAVPVEFSHFDDGKFVGVGAYEVNGTVFHTKVDLDDFPKDFARLEDLESAVRVRSIDADAAGESSVEGMGLPLR